MLIVLCAGYKMSKEWNYDEYGVDSTLSFTKECFNYWFITRNEIDSRDSVIMWDSTLIPVRRNIALRAIIVQQIFGLSPCTFLSYTHITDTRCEDAYKIISSIPE